MGCAGSEPSLWTTLSASPFSTPLPSPWLLCLCFENSMPSSLVGPGQQDGRHLGQSCPAKPRIFSKNQAHLRLLEFQPTCRCMSEDECLWPQDSASWGGVLGGVIIQPDDRCSRI